VWELVETPSVAVIGTREPSDEGRARARKLVRALEAGGQTIAVIGTPLGYYYPPESRELQDRIARDFLLKSQVPVLRGSINQSSATSVQNRWSCERRRHDP